MHLWWISLLDSKLLISELCVTSVTINQISLTTRLALNELQASCYSHHRSQSALSETNWPLRVSGCSPYLESLPSYTDGAPSWAPTNRGHGITSRPLKRDPEVPPRDPKEIYALTRTNNHSSNINECKTTFTFPSQPPEISFSYVESIPTSHSQP